MSKRLPTKWKGAYRDVATMTDDERREAGLSWSGSIQEIIGWTQHGVKDGFAAMVEAIDYARAKRITGFDTETGPKPEFADDPEAALDPYKAQIILLQLGDDERQYLIWWQTLSPEAQALFKDLLGDPEVRKVGVNLKFDLKMLLAQHGLDWRGERLLDTQLIEQIVNCGLTGNIGQTLKLTAMGPMALRWLGLKMVKDEETRTGWEKMIPGQWADQKKRYYAADDVVIPIALIKQQAPWVEEFEITEGVKLEMAFLPVLAEMEVRGLTLDWEQWAELAKEADEGFERAVKQLDVLFDVTVTYRVDLNGHVTTTRDKNFGSKDQLKTLIREWMWEHEQVDVIGNNTHFKESLLRAGMNPARVARLFQQKLVPDPADSTGKKRKQVGYPNMTDYIEGSQFVDSLWAELREFLPEKCFALPSTNSKMLRLLRILHETPDAEIDDVPEIPTKIGLPPQLVDPILSLREYSTKKSRYGWSWADLIHPVSGRIHSDFTQCAADTLRLTSRPNFQNIPADARYRAAIKARPGYVIVGADFSQIEPRIIGEKSLCPVYMRVFWSDRPGTDGFNYWCGPEVTEQLDLYGAVGATIGIMPPDAEKKSIAKLPENKKGRGKSKIGVLGLGYGTGPPKFHITFILDTKQYQSRQESDGFFNGFWTAVPEVKHMLDALSALADPKKSTRRAWHPMVEEEITWSESLGGMRRWFDRGSPQWWTQGRNHPIQSSGAEILKHTCVRFGRWLWKEGIDGFIILTAHDEILAEVPEQKAERVKRALEYFMTSTGEKYCTHVPITAEGTISPHWIKD